MYYTLQNKNQFFDSFAISHPPRNRTRQATHPKYFAANVAIVIEKYKHFILKIKKRVQK